jgi:hypothetical protein
VYLFEVRTDKCVRASNLPRSSVFGILTIFFGGNMRTSRNIASHNFLFDHLNYTYLYSINRIKRNGQGTATLSTIKSQDV